MTVLTFAVAGLLAWLVPTAALAQTAVYRWKDAKGRVHFSNVQPGEGSTPEGAAKALPESASPPAPAAESFESAAPAEPARAAEPAAAAPATPPRAGTPGPFSALSGDVFSTKVTSERLSLRRQLAAAKRDLADATNNYEREILRKGVPTPAQVHDRIFVGVTGVENGSSPDREEEYRERKERAEKRVAEIRGRYDQLENEAVRRYGSLPGWWLPLE